MTLPCTLPKRKLLATLVLVLLAFRPRNHRPRDTICSLRIKLLNFDLEKNTNLRVEIYGGSRVVKINK